MRKLTFLPLLLTVAACSSEDRCDPFLEAMDCIHGQTPATVRRYGTSTNNQNPTVTSPQVGPSAGSANGPGPSPGFASGGAPTPGSGEGAGPTLGSAQGAGPSSGSTNPADATCASFCRSLYTVCARELSQAGKVSLHEVISECTTSCECIQAVAPDCVDTVLGAFGPCLDRGSCEAIAMCFDAVGNTVPEPVSCQGPASDACGGGRSVDNTP
jgi:hypothetical protein